MPKVKILVEAEVEGVKPEEIRKTVEAHLYEFPPYNVFNVKVTLTSAVAKMKLSDIRGPR